MAFLMPGIMPGIFGASRKPSIHAVLRTLQKKSYCHFQIFADTLHPDEPIAEIVTNAAGYGLWAYNAKHHEYHQILGTCQYALPKTSRALRQRLKKCALETLQELEMRGLLSDAEAQILVILEKDCERKQRQKG